MNIIERFKTVSEDEKRVAVESLIQHATPDKDFFIMMGLSVLVATFGLLANSETVIIGSMLLAPLLYPILGLALGVSMSDEKLIRRSAITIGKAMLYAISISAAASILFAFAKFNNGMDLAILSRTNPSLLHMMVGIASGIAVTYALIRPSLSETLPGVAVAASLIPPLAVVGIGLARFDLTLISGALMLFIANVLGIVAASSLSFSIMNIRSGRRVAETTMKKEDKRVEEEKVITPEEAGEQKTKE